MNDTLLGGELRHRKICGRLAQDLVGLTQFTVLSLQRLHPVSDIAGHAGSQPAVDLGLFYPLMQRLARAPDLRRDRYHGRPVRRVRHSDEQIAFALKQAETGTPVAEVIRRMGISEQTFYRWKKVYGGLGVGELRRLKLLEEENRKALLSLSKGSRSWSPT